MVSYVLLIDYMTPMLAGHIFEQFHSFNLIFNADFVGVFFF